LSKHTHAAIKQPTRFRFWESLSRAFEIAGDGVADFRQ
jgi:hypothetical protein